MDKIDKLRKEAIKYPIVWRSCWNCNPAHEHLKKEDKCVILCLECGRYYFRGEDITEDESEWLKKNI